MLDEVNNGLEDDIDNLMNNLYSKFVLEERLENGLDSDDESLNLLLPEAGEIEFGGRKKHAPYAKEQCSLKADIIHQFPEHHILFDAFSAVTNLDELVQLLVEVSNLYSQQNGRTSHTNKQEMTAFLRINYIMSINKLPILKRYCKCGEFIRGNGIRNVMAIWRFEDIFKNPYFS